MSWAKVAGGACVALVVGLAVVIGRVWGKSEGEVGRRAVNEENERLRRQMRSVLKAIADEMRAKDQKIENLEAVIDRLINSPPANMNELGKRLLGQNLSSMQIEMIMVRTAPIYGAQNAG
ncbi:MAG: hypothetical protein WCC64_09605 [Aliidongia sp.]